MAVNPNRYRTPYRSKTQKRPSSSPNRDRKAYKSKTHNNNTRRNAKSTINKLSELLLGTNKVLRDVNAVNKGTILTRIGRRFVGKGASQGMGSIFKK